MPSPARLAGFLAVASAPLLLGCGEEQLDEPLGVEVAEIIGGTEAVPYSRPWQANVFIALQGELEHFCGGSLVAPSWVLTAAHCAFVGSVRLDADYYYVVLGDHHSPSSTGWPEQVRRLAEDPILHPDYRKVNGVSATDFALLHLDVPVQISAETQVVRLANDHDLPGEFGNVTGWGDTSSNGGGGAYLMEANLPIVENSACDAASLARDLLPDEICAGIPPSIGGFINGGPKAACHGDSGGPMAIERSPGYWELAGVTSWGDPDCSSYTVFGRVSSHRDWIRRYAPDVSVMAALL